jgi:hypothetical protein
VEDGTIIHKKIIWQIIIELFVNIIRIKFYIFGYPLYDDSSQAMPFK